MIKFKVLLKHIDKNMIKFKGRFLKMQYLKLKPIK